MVFVVNGEEYEYEVHPAEHDLPVRMYASSALLDSQNMSRPPNEWELRFDWGGLVPDDAVVGSVADKYMYLTLRLGVGG